jgi:hypothetical protein
VSIKMAKNQNIALNPAKVSGQCGRLKCCLVYEEAQYIEAGKKLPRLGKRVETPDGPGRVDDLNILQGKVRVSFPDRPPATYEAADVRLAATPDARGSTPPDARGPAPAAEDPPPDDEPGPPGRLTRKDSALVNRSDERRFSRMTPR